jgi:acetoacetate decarboxylase
MLTGYSLPRTPKGQSCIVPTPPWHFVGNAVAVSFDADEKKIKHFLPEGLELESNKCSVYFAEWQTVSENQLEYLDPIRSQYKETIVLLSAKFEGTPVSYCPFIWVDQDISLVRGLFQGWPKQMGTTWVTRAYDLPSKATPVLGKGGRFGATLASRERRLIEAQIILNETAETLPSPNFAKAVNVRYFPNLVSGEHHKPLINELVQLKSRDVSISTIWKGDAELKFYDSPYLELSELSPVSVNAGYRCTFAMTIDDIVPLRDLNK